MTKVVNHRERFEGGLAPFLWMHDLFQCSVCSGYAYVATSQYGDKNDGRVCWQYWLVDNDLRADVRRETGLYIEKSEDPTKPPPCPREGCVKMYTIMFPILNRDQLIIVWGSPEQPLKHIKIPAPESIQPEDWPIRWVVAGKMKTLVHSN